MPPRLEPGRVFERVFAMYRAQASLLLPAALLVFLPPTLLLVLGSVLELAILVLLSVVALIVAQFWLQGMVVESVRDMLDGRRDLTLEGLLGSATPVLGALIGAGILAGLGVALGLVLLIVPGLYLLTIWALIAPVIVVERAPVMASFGRSRALVAGNGWRVFAVVAVFALLNGLFANLLQVLGDEIGGDVGTGIGQLVAAVLLAPLSALAASIMYFTLTRHGDVAGESWAPPGEDDRAGGEGEAGGWAPPAPAEPPPREGGSGGWAPPSPPGR